jgi:uncharacterized protein (DUF2252 family)
MGASIVLAGLEASHKIASCTAAAERFAASYCSTVACLADEPILTAARYQIHRVRESRPISAALRQAERARPLDSLAKYTQANGAGHRHFKEIPSALWRVQPAQRAEVLEALTPYRDSLGPERLHLLDLFKPLDVAFKIVGTGSVGLRDYVVLMEGNGHKDPLFLQIKQEMPSAYAPYLPAQFSHQGRRVAEGQRRIQPLSDLLLGWTKIGQHDFLVRQLNDHKGGVELARLKGEGLNSLAAIAGELLARGHARSGDALTIHGYLGSGDKAVKALVQYALRYAALAHADFAAFQKSIEEKRIKIAG